MPRLNKVTLCPPFRSDFTMAGPKKLVPPKTRTLRLDMDFNLEKTTGDESAAIPEIPKSLINFLLLFFIPFEF